MLLRRSISLCQRRRRWWWCWIYALFFCIFHIFSLFNLLLFPQFNILFPKHIILISHCRYTYVSTYISLPSLPSLQEYTERYLTKKGGRHVCSLRLLCLWVFYIVSFYPLLYRSELLHILSIHLDTYGMLGQSEDTNEVIRSRKCSKEIQYAVLSIKRILRC